MHDLIKNATFRYIKLGPANTWAGEAIGRGELYLGHKQVPHDLASSLDRPAIVQHLVSLGRAASKAGDYAREIIDFYSQPSSTIWITFHDGALWWCRAEEDVNWIGETAEHGARRRKTIGPWLNTDINGNYLRQNQLSTILTGVAGYQQTLCGIRASDYLRRKLLCEENPLVTTALDLQSRLIATASGIISSLHWKDFETLVDLLMWRGGWHRTSTLGGTMKDADLLVEDPVTGETALVQVKSTASQAILDDYINRLDANPSWTRLIFACHSPKGTLAAPDRTDVTLWTDRQLAETAIKSGLLDWLVERAS